MRPTMTFAGLFVIRVVLMFIPILGWIIALLLIPVGLILWLVVMFKAYQGEKFKLPIVGDMAEQKI